MLIINILFRTNNNLNNILRLRCRRITGNSSGVYRMHWGDCNKYYIGHGMYYKVLYKVQKIEIKYLY